MGAADLTEYEILVLEQVAGDRDDIPWGGAMGEALGSLKGHGLIVRIGERYALTDDGMDFLVRRRIANSRTIYDGKPNG